VSSRPRVLVLGGSLADPSHTAALMRAFERALIGGGAATCRWDIAQRQLPLLRPGVEADPVDPARRALLAAADAADALVIVTPLYHASFSGAVKAALDHLSPRQLTGKPVGLASNSGGASGAQAVDHLRAVVRALHAVAIPQQVVTVDAQYALVSGQFRLADADALGRVRALGEHLLWFAERLRRDGATTETSAPRPRAAA
jgi:azobenzene reductase